jgi:hypothetical protein
MTEQTQAASRTKRVNLTHILPTEANSFTLTVSAEVIGTDSVITFTKQTPVVDEFWAQVLVKGIIERFATVVASSAGNSAIMVERLTKEVEALNSGNYATRGGKGSTKTDFINTVVAMAFVALFGKDVRVNEDNFQEVMGNVDALQAADEAYQALTKEEKAAAVSGYAKVAAGISYFKSALAE